ncbi:MAG: molybdenum cofactor biosynthesis protein MoaE [Chloroflexota bacterium]|nr:MAG: molybdenum cofactor biosynthesis protein MoaE [Chloroflexota bacterium]
MTHQIRVLFFANLREIVGERAISLEIPEGTRVMEFKVLIGELYPGLDSHLSTAIVAVNKEFGFDGDVIPADSEVALFPPVSGGDEVHLPGNFSVTYKEIDLDAMVKSITTDSTGAVCVFTGIVRAVTSKETPRETKYLEYQAYQDMAIAKMRQVAEEIRDKWSSVEGIAIIQRLGQLDAGTPTVVIACSAGHRDSGVFEAARYGIDRLKQIVPIWKKEVGPAGEEWIEGEYVPKPGE